MCAKKAAIGPSVDPAARKEKAIKVLRDAFEQKLKETAQLSYQLPQGALVVDEIPADAAFKKTVEVAKSLYDQIMESGRFALDVPSRSSTSSRRQWRPSSFS